MRSALVVEPKLRTGLPYYTSLNAGARVPARHLYGFVCMAEPGDTTCVTPALYHHSRFAGMRYAIC